MLTLGTELVSSRRARDLARLEEPVFAAVGLHPNDANSDGDVDWRPYLELASDPKVIAWGEIGLDYHWDTTPPDRQKHVFREQLALARDLKLPVSVHIRKAHEDTLAILREPPHRGVTGILHCWSGTLEQAREAADLGFLIGIGGPITYRKSNTAEIAAALDWDDLVVETDSPYLAPVPQRGRRNEPALIRHTFDALVAAKGDLDPKSAAVRLWNNFRRVLPRFAWAYETARSA
jgi:TatD DNase family protein